MPVNMPPWGRRTARIGGMFMPGMLAVRVRLPAGTTLPEGRRVLSRSVLAPGRLGASVPRNKTPPDRTPAMPDAWGRRISRGWPVAAGACRTITGPRGSPDRVTGSSAARSAALHTTASNGGQALRRILAHSAPRAPRKSARLDARLGARMAHRAFSTSGVVLMCHSCKPLQSACCNARIGAGGAAGASTRQADRLRASAYASAPRSMWPLRKVLRRGVKRPVLTCPRSSQHSRCAAMADQQCRRINPSRGAMVTLVTVVPLFRRGFWSPRRWQYGPPRERLTRCARVLAFTRTVPWVKSRR